MGTRPGRRACSAGVFSEELVRGRARRRHQHQPHAAHAADARVAASPATPAPALRIGCSTPTWGDGAALPPAALPAQRPDPLLAHDLRRLRRQGARGRRMGSATRSCAPRARCCSRPGCCRCCSATASRADAAVPRRAARGPGDRPPRRRLPGLRRARRGRARARRLRPLARVLDDDERRGELEASPRRPRRLARLPRCPPPCRRVERGLLVLLFDTELLPHVREHGIF